MSISDRPPPAFLSAAFFLEYFLKRKKPSSQLPPAPLWPPSHRKSERRPGHYDPRGRCWRNQLARAPHTTSPGRDDNRGPTGPRYCRVRVPHGRRCSPCGAALAPDHVHRPRGQTEQGSMGTWGRRPLLSPPGVHLGSSVGHSQRGTSFVWISPNRCRSPQISVTGLRPCPAAREGGRSAAGPERTGRGG